MVVPDYQNKHKVVYHYSTFFLCILANAASPRKTEFPELLRVSTTNAITSMLGEKALETIIFHTQLDKCYHDPKLLHERLCTMFEEGAAAIEKVIVREMFKILNLDYDQRGNFDFERYVLIAKRHITKLTFEVE